MKRNKTSALKSLRTERVTLTWNMRPPHNVSAQTHKFSLIDAIEAASLALGTDHWTELEHIQLGGLWRSLVSTMPQFQPASLTDKGLMPMDDRGRLMGMLGIRKIYFCPDLPKDEARVKNARNTAVVKMVDKAYDTRT